MSQLELSGRPSSMGGEKKKKKTYFKMTKSDSSIFASYTHLTLAYRVVCRIRYLNARKEQRRQFISEVAAQEMLQALALDGVRLHREFCQYIFSKPSAEEKITFTDKEERRLMKIMDS
ncbi:uncharacterized protein [Onthophagus taurus]|uniref:uncharacterized protein n=1 Tax=Onthophagus taurus TaxID=166361 RepID=UPI000C20A0F7|nr:uncharacterized protein LOC111415039 [Onthophagus taurus]